MIGELTQAHLLRATLSARQLDEVLVDFWLNHFNVFVGKGQVREYLPEYERDVIRPRVLGSFRDLLGAVAHSPAMLFYLDNWQSAAPNSGPPMPPQLQQRLNDPRLSPTQRQLLQARFLERMAQRPKQTRGLNENYGRELMELHTLGVDGGYTQKDVIEVARALTGWTIDRPQQGGGFVFRPEIHDTGEKVILGHRFPAGHGQDEGERVLDLLAAHPATAHHIAYQLAQRFVADEPPAGLVDRAARTFLDTKGDLRAVVRTHRHVAGVLCPRGLSREGQDAARVRGVGRPRVGRHGDQRAADGPGAPDPARHAALRLPAADRLQQHRGRVGQHRRAAQSHELRACSSSAARRAACVSRSTRWRRTPARPPATGLVGTLLGGDVSDSTRQVLAKAETPQQMLALVLGSPEFQRR